MSANPESVDLSENSLNAAADAAIAAFEQASDLATLEEAHRAHLGEQAFIPQARRALGQLPKDQRKDTGRLVNMARGRVEMAYAQVREVCEAEYREQRLKDEKVDVTVSTTRHQTGAMHPITALSEHIADIFLGMGWEVAEGPEVEAEYFNFDALNFIPDHPARTLQDTFYIGTEGSRQVLRTHTSPVQIRAMQAQGAPIRVIAPGRVYRMDMDQTHTPMFHQVEGLAIGRDISMANLKWTLEEFCRAFFEVPSVELRFRASHFPFTEPSAEVDIRCDWSGGQLKIGEGESWLEILGSGMVHPKVLAAAGVDPAEWQGFAFGMGIDRIAMLKYGIPDLRAFFESDLRWLRHYGFAAGDVPSVSGGLSR